MEAPDKRLKARVAFLGCLLATLVISIAIINSHIPTYDDLSASANDHHRELSLRSVTSQFRDPKSVADKTPHFWKYAYIIVNYHKSGHSLSDVLVKHINSNLRPFGGDLRRNDFQPRSHFTKCNEISFPPGTITVIGRPEFHCNTEQLRDLLMNHPDPKITKWGVKIIHLVRNPFTMAVSNYHYHSQNPTPEPFENWKNPCSGLTQPPVGSTDATLIDLAAPLLSHPKVKIRVNGKAPQLQPVMTHEDFKNIVDDCYSLYQTKPGLENATFNEHLRSLDSTEGLRMATAEKMNNIVLMAIDLLLFIRVHNLVKASSPNHINGDIEVKTLSIDDFIHQPGSSMYGVYDFIFKDLLPEETKIIRSQTYEQSYLRERESHHYMNNHITYGKFEDTVALMEYLRKDAVFGPPLTRIEALLDEILYQESFRHH
jgi:hypothetical protein